MHEYEKELEKERRIVSRTDRQALGRQIDSQTDRRRKKDRHVLDLVL